MKSISITAAITVVTIARIHHKVLMEDFSEKTILNNIDHFETIQENKQTYSQRYWLNSQYFDEASGPVFLYLCGEWTCTPPDTKMYPFMVGADNDAMLITLEHRYYGISQPFVNWSTPNLRYLNSRQALADTAYFIDQMNL